MIKIIPNVQYRLCRLSCKLADTNHIKLTPSIHHRRTHQHVSLSLLSEKPVTTTTTSDDVDEYQYVMIEEKPQANDRAIDDEDEDYDSWDEDEDDSSDSPDTEDW